MRIHQTKNLFEGEMKMETKLKNESRVEANTSNDELEKRRIKNLEGMEGGRQRLKEVVQNYEHASGQSVEFLSEDYAVWELGVIANWGGIVHVTFNVGTEAEEIIECLDSGYFDSWDGYYLGNCFSFVERETARGRVVTKLYFGMSAERVWINHTLSGYLKGSRTKPQETFISANIKKVKS